MPNIDTPEYQSLTMALSVIEIIVTLSMFITIGSAVYSAFMQTERPVLDFLCNQSRLIVTFLEIICIGMIDALRRFFKTLS